MWNKLALKNNKCINMPKPNVPVLAIGEWLISGKQIPCIVKYVEEEDCCWRTVDDDSEISYSFNIVKWMEIPE